MSSRTGRNDPCPCGSGRKFKRCCIDRWRQFERTAEAAGELLRLAELFPLLRPREEAFERWLAEHGGTDPSQELVEAGLETLSAKEVARIAGANASEFPDVWRSIVDDFRNEALAREIVVIGAVAAALAEPRELDVDALATLEEDAELAADPAEALAVVVDGCALWSIAETSRAFAALAWPGPSWAVTLAAEAARLWSVAHAERLDVLVARVSSLPVSEDFPRASKALAAACEAYSGEASVRDALAALLLEQALITSDLELLAAA